MNLYHWAMLRSYALVRRSADILTKAYLGGESRDPRPPRAEQRWREALARRHPAPPVPEP